MSFHRYTNAAERAEMKAWFQQKFAEVYSKYYDNKPYHGNFEFWEQEARDYGYTSEEDVESYAIYWSNMSYNDVVKEMSYNGVDIC